MNCNCRGRPVPVFGGCFIVVVEIHDRTDDPEASARCDWRIPIRSTPGKELSEPARCRMPEETPALDSRRAPGLYCGVLTPLTWHSCPLGVHVRNRARADAVLLQHEYPCCSELQAQHQL